MKTADLETVVNDLIKYFVGSKNPLFQRFLFIELFQNKNEPITIINDN